MRARRPRARPPFRVTEAVQALAARIEAVAPPVYEANVFTKGVTRFDVRLHGRGGG